MTLAKLDQFKDAFTAARSRYASALEELYPEGTRVRYKTHGMKQWRTATVHSTWVDYSGYVTLTPDHAKPKHGWVPNRRVYAEHVEPLS